MFLSILTPLDRTSFAEQSLPLAAGIARRANAKLDLVEVHSLYALEAPSAGWIPFDTESDDECRQQEQLYLDATAKRVTLMSEIPVTTGVLAGCVVLPKMIADSILERAKSDKTDLIVMVTHGHGQVNRAVGGSVADELVRRASIPVLLVRPGEKANDIIPEPVIDNILIALDGSPLAEQVLDPAFDLARLMEATCKLIRVVPPESSQGDLKSGAASERQEAEIYLERVANRLRTQGVEAQTHVLAARHVVDAVIKEAQAQTNCLIALSTRGRGGLKRLVLGSVADQLIRTSELPVLVYCPSGKES